MSNLVLPSHWSTCAGFPWFSGTPSSLFTVIINQRKGEMKTGREFGVAWYMSSLFLPAFWASFTAISKFDITNGKKNCFPLARGWKCGTTPRHPFLWLEEPPQTIRSCIHCILNLCLGSWVDSQRADERITFFKMSGEPQQTNNQGPAAAEPDEYVDFNDMALLLSLWQESEPRSSLCHIRIGSQSEVVVMVILAVVFPFSAFYRSERFNACSSHEPT